MKKIIMLIIGVLAASVLALPLVADTFKKGATVYVSVQNSTIKDSTKLFAKTVATVTYGDSVTVVSSDTKKTQVTTGSNVTGWIATGSLTKKKIIKSASGSTVKASSDEIALAGKGFSEEAENAYKASNPELDYDEVDKIEQITVQESTLKSFAQAGKLTGGNE